MRFPKQFVTSGAMARARDLTGGDLRVLLALIVTAGDDAVASPTQSELSGITGLGRRFVRDRLEHLHNAGYIEAQSGRGKTATYTLKLAGPPAISVETPTRVLNSPTGTNHQNEPFARSALTTLRADRRLPLSIDELLARAYNLGKGDPWDGYLRIKQSTEAALTGARDPAAVLRARLDAA